MVIWKDSEKQKPFSCFQQSKILVPQMLQKLSLGSLNKNILV